MRFVAGRGADAEVFLAVGAVAKRHREADSGWSAAKRHREDAAGRGRRSGRDTAGRAPRSAQVVFTSTSCADSALWCPARVQSEESPPPVYL